MSYLQNIPAEAIILVVCVAIAFAVMLYYIRTAEEKDEDEILFGHLNGLDRDIRKPGLDDIGPSAGSDSNNKNK